MLSALGPEKRQYATITKFIHNDLGTERKKGNLASPTWLSTNRAVERTECLTARTVETAAG